MGRFNDCVRHYLAVLLRIAGPKKEEPDHDTEPDAKVPVDAESDCCCTCPEAHTSPPQHKPPPPPPAAATKKGWNYRPRAEFPWRLEQTVEEEENWRGTWVLEVRDMRAMDWGTARVPKADGDGRRVGGRYRRRPTRHLPFPVDGGGHHRETLAGGQDDLMVQLGRR